MESNIIFHKGASIFLDFDSKFESKVSIENITFVNCYGSEMSCIIAFSQETLIFHFLQLQDIYLNITQVNWLTAFQEHFNNLDYVNEIYSDSISKYSYYNNSECMGYPKNYFEFNGVSTEVINFQLHDTNLKFNESCLSHQDILTFPSFFLYSNIKLAAFGKSIAHINKSNENNDILFKRLTILPDLNEICIYDQISIKSKLIITIIYLGNSINYKLNKFIGRILTIQDTTYMFISSLEFSLNQNLEFLKLIDSTSRIQCLNLISIHIHIYIYILGNTMKESSLISILNNNNYLYRVNFRNNNFKELIKKIEIKNVDKSMLIYHSDFENNQAESTIIQISQGELIVDQCIFIENNLRISAGIILGSSGNIKLRNTKISKLSNLDDLGQGTKSFISISESTLEMKNCSIVGGPGNIAQALYSMNSHVIIESSLFNTSIMTGTLLFSSSDQYIYIYIYKYIYIYIFRFYSIAHSRFSQLETKLEKILKIEMGGNVSVKSTVMECGFTQCIYLEASQLTLSNSSFSGKKAQIGGSVQAEFGGCLYLKSEFMEITNINVSHCRAKKGGGIAIQNQLPIPVQNTSSRILSEERNSYILVI